VYGGYGLAKFEVHGTAKVSEGLVPFSLPGELIDALALGQNTEMKLISVLEASAERVQPGCPHFGLCGGCHLQMGNYPEQLRLKRAVLQDALLRACVAEIPEIHTHAAEPWGYRNRIRLHIFRESEGVRFGYRERASHRPLPISTCPIAAPLLWQMAETMLALAGKEPIWRRWLESAEEVELFCDDKMSRIQLQLLCTRSPASLSGAAFVRSMELLQDRVLEFAGAGAVLVHAKTGQVREELASWGASGLSYEAAGERYWIRRGGFFQVNRFLVSAMVDLVCSGRAGTLAWDLFAGVGLFACVLARSFDRVTGVEANAEAAGELRSALARIGPQNAGIQGTTAEFLRRAVLERDRPELIVMDPPRAGAGREVCELLIRIAPAEVVYVSCDPLTLARDLAILQDGGYALGEVHLLDLFPQTYHQEAVVMLRRRS
jgi:23S rRNA (uracil1939-C5)-methyltransferase